MTLLDVPEDWHLAIAPRPGISMVARPPGEAGEVAQVLLELGEVGEVELRDWQREVDVSLPGLVVGYQLLDLELVTVAGHPGVRRLATHTGVDGTSMTLEQWATLVRGRGFTVTASCPTLRYAELGPHLGAVATTLRPPGSGR